MEVTPKMLRERRGYIGYQKVKGSWRAFEEYLGRPPTEKEIRRDFVVWGGFEPKDIRTLVKRWYPVVAAEAEEKPVKLLVESAPNAPRMPTVA